MKHRLPAAALLLAAALRPYMGGKEVLTPKQ